MRVEVGGIIGLIGLALTIWALINVVLSGATTGAKVLWVLLLILIPFIGFIIWFFAGPRKA
jgi:hypothetical protein